MADKNYFYDLPDELINKITTIKNDIEKNEKRLKKKYATLLPFNCDSWSDRCRALKNLETKIITTEQYDEIICRLNTIYARREQDNLNMIEFFEKLNIEKRARIPDYIWQEAFGRKIHRLSDCISSVDHDCYYQTANNEYVFLSRPYMHHDDEYFKYDFKKWPHSLWNNAHSYYRVVPARS